MSEADALRAYNSLRGRHDWLEQKLSEAEERIRQGQAQVSLLTELLQKALPCVAGGSCRHPRPHGFHNDLLAEIDAALQGGKSG